MRREPIDAAIIASIALAFGAAARLSGGFDQPFWIDETFTGAIAGQRDWAGLLHQVHADVNAPLYYVVTYAWASVAGLSNAALRLPSAVFGILAAIVAIIGTTALGRRTCLLWGALLGLWAPGIAQASEARCYALLLLTATATTVAFARLLAEADRRAASVWAGLGALTVLTHYFAVPLILAQGLILVVVHRGRALRLWPALGFLLPAVGWIGFHAQRLGQFSHPDVAWYAPLSMEALPSVAAYVLNHLPGIGAVLVTSIALIMRRRRQETAAPGLGLAVWVAAASMIGLAIVIAGGMLRPSFSYRYGIPFVPGLLLGMAAALNVASHGRTVVAVIVVSLFGAPVALLDGPSRSYSFEAAAGSIADKGVTRLVFLWDHPSSPVQDDAQMRDVAAFFIRRAGRDVDVVNVVNPWREDPHPRLLEAAGSEPRTAILWVYDAALPKTAALAHPPRIAQDDPAWACRNHGTDPFVALVCLREGG